MALAKPQKELGPPQDTGRQTQAAQVRLDVGRHVLVFSLRNWNPIHHRHACHIYPAEDDRDKERTPLDSLAAVHRWTTNFFRERIDREDNTPTLTRLHQFRKLGRTNAVTLCRTLLERQDVIQMGREDFW